MKIAVRGIGAVSSAGAGCGFLRSALISGHGNFAYSDRVLGSVHRFPVGVFPASDGELARLCGAEEDAVMPRGALLGVLAVREALQDAGFRNAGQSAENGRHGDRTALVSATSVGGMDLTEKLYGDYTDGGYGIFRVLPSHECGAVTDMIASRSGISGYRTTLSTACSSASNAIMHGARLLLCGHADRVVAGGTDPLSLFTLNGFHSLQILDSGVCHPFDVSRKGLNLGEGAAYIVMERLADGEPVPAGTVCLEGWCNSNDGFHQTASSESGDGACASMSGAMRMAGIRTVDYVIAHGTGTVNNDLSEGFALRRVFGDRIPAFSSLKAVTGHTLAASGAVNAVAAVMSMRYGEIYPSAGFAEADPAHGLVPLTGYGDGREVRSVMVNSFGFGGNCTSLVFRKY